MVSHCAVPAGFPRIGARHRSSRGTRRPEVTGSWRRARLPWAAIRRLRSGPATTCRATGQARQTSFTWQDTADRDRSTDSRRPDRQHRTVRASGTAVRLSSIWRKAVCMTNSDGSDPRRGPRRYGPSAAFVRCRRPRRAAERSDDRRTPADRRIGGAQPTGPDRRRPVPRPAARPATRARTQPYNAPAAGDAAAAGLVADEPADREVPAPTPDRATGPRRADRTAGRPPCRCRRYRRRQPTGGRPPGGRPPGPPGARPVRTPRRPRRRSPGRRARRPDRRRCAGRASC